MITAGIDKNLATFWQYGQPAGGSQPVLVLARMLEVTNDCGGSMFSAATPKVTHFMGNLQELWSMFMEFCEYRLVTSITRGVVTSNWVMLWIVNLPAKFGESP